MPFIFVFGGKNPTDKVEILLGYIETDTENHYTVTIADVLTLPLLDLSSS